GAGDDGEFKSQGGAGFGDAAGLVVIDGQRTAFLYSAESAAARTHVAEDHEGGGAAVPAIANVGAGGALTHGMEVQFLHQLFEVVIVFAYRSGGAQPDRSRRAGFGINA